MFILFSRYIFEPGYFSFLSLNPLRALTSAFSYVTAWLLTLPEYLVLNSSENGGYHCLVPDFHRNASGFTALSKMLWNELVVYAYSSTKILPYQLKQNLWALHCDLGISKDLYLNKCLSKNRSKFSILVLLLCLMKTYTLNKNKPTCGACTC